MGPMLVTMHGVVPMCMPLQWHAVRPLEFPVSITLAARLITVLLTLDPLPLELVSGAMTRPVLQVCTLRPTRRGMVT